MTILAEPLRQTGVTAAMTIDAKILALPTLFAAALALAGFGYAANKPASEQRETLEEQTMTRAEIEFPDAPHGVDPIVTGPRTASFKERQDRAACDQAAWPEIPITCYPSR
ncbi:MAG: hypothetical protein K5872_00065 [Rhizobiaceae bacterium]|nr:hypothetical protein [Rhizobiaceae bacterium]MCV0404601.1 hypothetical protein [Rhizobiaceae bacterium]